MKTAQPGEVINDLLGYDGLKIIQRPDMFNFSLDSTLLADFTVCHPSTRHILDLGTGFAPIPLFLSLKTKAKITGVEIQPDVADIARRNVDLNNLQNQIEIVCDDIKHLPRHLPASSVDIITCNPPFFKVTPTSNVNDSPYKTLARHEVAIDLPHIAKVSQILLKTRGRLFMVHRAERLFELTEILHAHRLQVKRLRYVYPRAETHANMVLLEAVSGGRPGVKVLPPLIVHKGTRYSDEILKIFHYGRM
ncbi:MAG: tRNA1(Val) (adenine(37)-N6)-methyltransferase [Acholeplasmatales bacterium]|nr:MAG: tRNA1(Val) (adenine(37)-N6)-methyltransferase [Acholeplasmatales bacterium]